MTDAALCDAQPEKANDLLKREEDVRKREEDLQKVNVFENPFCVRLRAAVSMYVLTFTCAVT